MTTTRPTRALGALTLGLALALTACGNSNDTTAADSSSSASDHNDADVSFASDMIQHHAQALTMVDLTVDRTMTPDFQALTEGIRDAQAPEIETMSDWLTSWGEDVPATVRDHMNAEGHDMGDMGADTGQDMPGMMSDEDLQGLADAMPMDFEDMWLAMMIQHHEGAITMAEAEVEDGSYQPAIDLAKQIIAAQTEEIATMTTMMGS